jgi:hypothetical protein
MPSGRDERAQQVADGVKNRDDAIQLVGIYTKWKNGEPVDNAIRAGNGPTGPGKPGSEVW